MKNPTARNVLRGETIEQEQEAEDEEEGRRSGHCASATMGGEREREGRMKKKVSDLWGLLLFFLRKRKKGSGEK